MLSEYRGIPWEARLLIYISFIPNVAIGFIYTDLTFFLSAVQGLPPSSAALAITTMGVSQVATSIPLGILADRYGRRKMVVLGNLCGSLSLIGFALTTNVGLILVVAILEGTGEAAYAVSIGALLADRSGDQKRTPAFSLFAFLGWIAGAAGAFSISFVAALQSFGLSGAQAHVELYVAVGLLSLSITPLIFRIHETPTIHEFRQRTEILPRKSGRVIKRFSIYSVAIALGAGLFVPLMTLWFSHRYGVADTVSGPILGFTSLLTAAAVFASPRLARRLGTVRAIVITEAASTVFMVAVPSAPTFGISASVYTVRVFLMNLSNPLNQSLIMGLVSPDERGMASGITASLWRLPNALTAAVGGSLIQSGLLALPFYIATVLYVFGISVLWFLFKDAKLPEEKMRDQLRAQSSSVEVSEDTR